VCFSHGGGTIILITTLVAKTIIITIYIQVVTVKVTQVPTIIVTQVPTIILTQVPTVILAQVPTVILRQVPTAILRQVHIHRIIYQSIKLIHLKIPTVTPHNQAGI